MGFNFGRVLATTSEGASINVSDFVKVVSIYGDNLTYRIYSTGIDEQAELNFRASAVAVASDSTDVTGLASSNQMLHYT